MIGRTLAHYEILERVGAGGMGEVYRARDTKLGREVAIKVLRPDVADESSRLARFAREAKAVAALKHPNIVTVYSVEESDGVRFLTMELVEGDPLSRLVGRHGLPLDRFFEIAIPLADALASAHAGGVTHRDVKPANIMVSREGRLKILDFGLAKLLDPGAPAGAGDSGLATVPLDHSPTGDGQVVGTAAYMSPEQAEGKQVDHRSDIFSLGIVLYEMATGMRPFGGDTPASVVSAILRDSPSSITDLNQRLPRHLGRIVMRCLAKAPERRFQTALDIRNELEELKREIESGEPGVEEKPASTASPRWRGLGLAAGVVIGAVAASLLLVRLNRGRESGSRAQPPRVTVSRFTDLPGSQGEPSISPDGRMVAYVGAAAGQSDIFLQRVGGGNAINLTADSTVDDAEPSFSPDGSHIAFRSEREGGGLFVMGATGESPRRVADFGHYPSWSPDGSMLLFSVEPVSDPRLGPNRSQIRTVDLASGGSRLVLEGQAAHPVWSPHGQRIAYWAVRNGRRDLWTVRPDGSDPRAVTDDDATDWRPLWTPDGEQLFFISDRGGIDNIWRVPIDEESGRLRGAPEPITSGASVIASYSISGDGRRIAGSVNAVEARLRKIGFDPESATLLGEPTSILATLAAVPRLSPDGALITYMTMFTQEDIFVVRSDGSGVRQLTDDPFRDRAPAWSPAGDRIAFFSNRSGKYEIWTIRPDGSGLRQETDRPDHDLLAPIWSPDGSRIACGDGAGANFIVDLAAEYRHPRGADFMTALPPFGNGRARFVPSDWSPDDRWIAGMIIDEHGERIGRTRYSLESVRYTGLISVPEPVELNSTAWWLPDSRRLLYDRKGRLFVLDFEDEEEREVPTPSMQEASFRGYFPARDGRILLEVTATSNSDIWLFELQPSGGVER